ncbi:uncharacterized protein LOC119586685 [Penaeus monodon]|uniref:uncharacterized protein LOC119586685 n=1 Tax=Penaeus monodon TaxID=6687 RepID=UPI0018A6EAE4|nr:uncharacterized protein LOC119586685 [Penaeus monodon]
MVYGITKDVSGLDVRASVKYPLVNVARHSGGRRENRLCRAFQGQTCSISLAVFLLVTHSALSEFYASTHNDILSAITWATLDFDQVGAPDLGFPRGANVTSVDLYDLNNLTARSVPRRRRRTLTLQPDGPASFVMSVKLVMPLLTLTEDAKVQLELPISRNLGSPWGTAREGGGWNLELREMASSLEEMVTMLGMDGRACIQRAVCELAASPSLKPRGLVGEMVQIFVRRILTESRGDLNEIGEGEKQAAQKGQYSEAGRYGRREGTCWQRYSLCPHSLFSLLSIQFINNLHLQCQWPELPTQFPQYIIFARDMAKISMFF